MRVLLASLLLSFGLVGAAAAEGNQPPPQCQQNGAGVVDWQACLNASPIDSPWRQLALINLGSEAFQRMDYASAVRYYDEAQPAGQEISSDIIFHTFRGVSYWRVGRADEAQADATMVFRMLQRDPMLTMPPSQYIPAGVSEDVVYAFILPVLQAGDQTQFQTALAAYRALPAGDWVDYGNRAAVFQEIGDIPAALEMSGRALAAAPDEPGVLNNHCYILLQAGRAEDALPFCQRAVDAAPSVAAVRHSLASVLAALGRCAEAEAQLAQARRLDSATIEYQQPLECAAN